jgi:cell division protein FtsI/penicillin-binding protein 2
LLIAAVYGLIVRRGFRIARAAPSDYAFFLGLAVTLMLIVPVLVMAGGMLGLIPLTGVVTPFLSYGGSAMVVNLTGLGILSAIHGSRRTIAATEPFKVPLRALGAVLGASAAVLVAGLVNVQAVQRDDYLVRPQLSMQADGGRRYLYNARVLDVVRQIPRGTIFDRQGLPLATGDPDLVAKSADDFRTFGIAADRACPNRDERCYPLGGVGFHLLGDAKTRLNWSASNTSYVERDAEDRLRGFSDHAATIRTTDESGETTVAVKRDYREVVPLVRHRYQPNHPAVKAVLKRPRDLRLTLDARLQVRVGSILSRYAKASESGHAAAVVIDADTGAILAAVSYPWPDLEAIEENVRQDAGEIEDELLDRARYGLYPPGSTYKMVTAAAALDATGVGAMRFACRRLPDGRVGAALPGLRPVRDDVRDEHPHGTLGLHEAIVVSCNAYFAQLALKIGRKQLDETSDRAGIPMPALRDRGLDALAHDGYGQGQVLATPLKMARVAAALGTDGTIRGPVLYTTTEAPKVERLIPAESSRLLARAMRDAVLRGTGRNLRTHPSRIAGKTGTAQVAGSPSHAWFAGFAPYGPATRRIAFAVILENAGYGGSTAAAAAGEIVSAASSLRLVREQ